VLLATLRNALQQAADRSRHRQSFQTLSAMKMYDELIVTGAWWD
jgi:hypothetical protein